MAKVTYRKTNNHSQIVIAILVLLVFLVYQFHFKEKWFDIGNSSKINVYGKDLLQKKEHLLTFDEWKNIADIRANEYYNCMKDLDMDYTKSYLSESCGNSYRNQYVKFREGLETRANLEYNQVRELLKYWDGIQERTTKKAIKAMEENDRKKRPNKYN